ncbi:MAG: hypothetical protein Q9172_004808 [Xanthocarpia lactea]
MPQSMSWHAWSGFTGEGTYVILNKASLTCLDLEEGSKEPGTKVQGFTHIPNNSAQLWDIRKRLEADVYYIQCKSSETVLTASGPESPVVGMPKGPMGPSTSWQHSLPKEALWVIDKSIYGLDSGKMVVFRNVKYPGYVLDLQHGEAANGTLVNLMQERGLSDEREMQKWLLQVQPK